MKFNISLLFLLAFAVSSCVQNDTNTEKDQDKSEAITVDSHSYSNHHEISTKHLHLELDVNFENQTIYGVARHEMNSHNAENAIFDIKELKIVKVTIGKGNEVATDYVIGKHDELLGSSLSVKIQPDTKYINIYYQTTENSEALDWLSPEQECANSCATTETKLLSPANKVGLANVKRGFSIPPKGNEYGSITISYLPHWYFP